MWSGMPSHIQTCDCYREQKRAIRDAALFTPRSYAVHLFKLIETEGDIIAPLTAMYATGERETSIGAIVIKLGNVNNFCTLLNATSSKCKIVMTHAQFMTCKDMLVSDSALYESVWQLRLAMLNDEHKFIIGIVEDDNRVFTRVFF
jgi:hypothetical protein